MFRWFVALSVAASTASGLAAAPIVNVYPSVAPNSSVFVPGAPVASGPLAAQGTPGWRGYVPNALAALQSANPAAAVIGAGTAAEYAVNSNPPRQWLTVSDSPLWRGVPDAANFLNERGNRLHFGLVVKAGPGEAFNLNGISFNFTDPAGELDPISIPSLGVAAGTSPSLLGRPVGGGPLGPVTNPNQLLSELYYVGVGTAYAPYNGSDRQFIAGQFSAPPFTLPIQAPNSLYAVRAISLATPVPLPPAVAVFAGLVGLTAVARRRRAA